VQIVEAVKHLVRVDHREVPVKEEVMVSTVHEVERIKEVPVIHEQLVPIIKEIPKIF
jgi:hypothetical protein